MEAPLAIRSGGPPLPTEHLTPDYLGEAIREVEAFFVEVGQHTASHPRFTCDSLAPIMGVVEGGRR